MSKVFSESRDDQNRKNTPTVGRSVFFNQHSHRIFPFSNPASQQRDTFGKLSVYQKIYNMNIIMCLPNNLGKLFNRMHFFIELSGHGNKM
jgi:hypothetical protein